ncbi:MAG: hypothetical protein HOP16_20525 [Acidobacteria bacterium]|nr:hypothetical protein [Acidobacteriota bacterium]
MAPRILVVDDEPNILGTLAPLLRARGYEVSTAMTGRVVRGNLVIDRTRFRVLRDGEEVRLTPKEFELLTFLAQHSGRVLTHRTLLKAIWGPNALDQPEHLRVLVGSLRKKIEPNPSVPKYILTEPWVGYRFADREGSESG